MLDDFDFNEDELTILELAEKAGMSVEGLLKFQTVLTPIEGDEPDRFSYHGTTPLRIVDHISASEWVKNRLQVSTISSNISSLAYDKKDKILIVGFHKGPSYLYKDVQVNEAMDLFNAASLGVHHRRVFYTWPKGYIKL